MTPRLRTKRFVMTSVQAQMASSLPIGIRSFIAAPLPKTASKIIALMDIGKMRGDAQ
jgi:hypothetical protein